MTERPNACTVRKAVRKGDDLYIDIDRNYNCRRTGLFERFKMTANGRSLIHFISFELGVSRIPIFPGDDGVWLPHMK